MRHHGTMRLSCLDRGLEFFASFCQFICSSFLRVQTQDYVDCLLGKHLHGFLAATPANLSPLAALLPRFAPSQLGCAHWNHAVKVVAGRKQSPSCRS